MKKIITLLATFTLLGGCSGNCGNKHTNSHEEKLHNKGIPIESHAPRHISGVTSEAARRASSATLKH
ncbi:MAG: hypothetical protein NWP47_04805 [Rickettsiaceae bacterium]|nr:hypothetical protein [Rickettsiaceae bacterium]